MSNFYPCSFTMNHECIGKGNDIYTYLTSEHAIMHIKARLMGDEEAEAKILAADKPATAKSWGRKVKPWDEQKWKDHVETIAEAVLLAKFTTNPALAQKLKDTGARTIAEAAPRDKIWGIGMSANEAVKGKAWKGRNLLGKTLMKVRAQL